MTARQQGVTIITGAAGGIGCGLVTSLAPTLRLVLVDLPARLRELIQLAEQTGAHAVAADVSVEHDVQALVAQARRLGPITGLVHCAGFTRHERIGETSVQDFQSLVNTNLLGTLLCMTAVAEQMQADAVSGSLVAISSINALIGAKKQAVYTATKAAIHSLVVSAAQEWGPSGIRVNAIAPGSIRTPGMNPQAGDDPELNRRIPLQRVGLPADLVGPVRFLLSDEAAYMTGTVVVVDGGLMLVRG